MRRVMVLIFLLVMPASAVQWLEQSTEIDVRVGPFVDVSDGYTPETGVALGDADEAELLKQNGAATVDISGAGWAAVANCDGWYDLTLTTDHTDTLGQLTVVVQDDNVCLPVHVSFMVVPSNVWDSMFGSDILHASLYEIDSAGGDQTVDDLADLADNGFDPETNGVLLQDGTGTGQIDLDAGTVLLRSATETQIDNIETDTGTTLDGIVDDILEDTGAYDTDGEYAAAIWNAAVASYGGAGTYGQNVEDILVDTGTTLDGIVDDILEDTGTTLDGIVDDILEDTGTTLDGIVDDILEDTGEIGSSGAGLSAVPWNSDWDAEVESEVDDSIGGGTGTALTAVPWNSDWDSEVQSEVADEIDDNNLNHLMKDAVANNDDMTTEVGDGTVLSNLLSSGSDTSTYVVADDALQAISEGAAGGGATAQQVWEYATRTLTALDEDSTTLDLDGTTVGDVTASVSVDELNGTSIAGTGTQVADAFEYWFDVATPAKTINDAGVAGSGLSAEDVWTYATRTLSALDEDSTTLDIDEAVWGVALPGSFTSGEAGYLLGTNLPLGAGANEWEYTLTSDATGDPISGARVWVTTDVAGDNMVAQDYTNTLGVVTFYLDDGTYYIWRSHSDYTFSNPDTETVP